jgi:nucleoside-diphosphate-sugar epimerase
VGVHACAAIVRAGHSLRLLARSPDKAARVLSTLGLETPEITSGDVTDPGAVKSAVEDCDAVVHAAGLLTFDRRRTQEMLDTNIEGSRLVLETARDQGLDPIVLISSISVLFPPEGTLLTPESSVKDHQDPYARSKAEAERIARAMQEQGAPVVCIYPGGVWGPDDPTLGNQITTIFAMVKGGYYLCPDATMTIVDARDLATLVTRTLAPGHGPRRFMLSGHCVTHDDLRRLFARVTGRFFLKVPVPGSLLRAVGRAGDFLRNHTGFDPGAVTYESMHIATSTYDGDDSRARDQLGVELRPLEETVTDQLRWMAKVNYMTARQLGKLA